MPLSNTQHRELMRTYEVTRQKALADLEERKEKIYKTSPRLLEIHESLVENASLLVRATIKKDADLIASLEKTRDALKMEQDRVLSSMGLSASDLSVTYECADCKDTGYIGNEKCHCLKQKMVSMFYNKSNLKDILERQNFDKLSMKYYDTTVRENGLSTYTEMERKINLLKDYVRDFDEKPDSLLLFGPSGVGKTFLTSCIAKELLDTEHSVLYYSASALMDTFAKETFTYEESEEEDLSEQYLSCDLLIIDDLGTERQNRFIEEKLFTCINERAQLRRATIINTNLDPEDLKNRYSERISSRLIGLYRLFHIEGDDIRIKMKYEKLK